MYITTLSVFDKIQEKARRDLQLIGPVSIQKARHINTEFKISTTVKSSLPSIDKNGSFVIHGTKVQQHAITLRPFGGYIE